MLIRIRVLPKALYGCGVCTPHDATVTSLRTAILRCLSTKSAARSTDLAFAFLSYGDDLDPWIYIAMKRALAFRRHTAKQPKLFRASKRTTHIL